MDDAAQPLDATNTEGETQPQVADDGTPPKAESVSDYAPVPREEVPARLDLDNDPFAPAPPAYPVLEREPLIPVLEPEAEPLPDADDGRDVAEPAVAADVAEESASEASVTESREGDTESGDAAPEETSTDAESGDLSIEAMVDELASGDTEETGEGAADAVEDAAPEASEAPGTAAEDAMSDEEPDAVAGPGSWRDAVASDTQAVSAPLLVRQQLSARLPFWVYGGAWVAFVGAFTYLMWPLADKPFVESAYYMYMVLGGAGMTALGPLLGLITWAVARAGTERSAREGLVRAVLLRAMGWTAVGVVLWWACLYALDLHRTGVLG